MERHRVKCLTGAVICITGLPLEMRNHLKLLVEQHGATYASELTKRCTHLVAAHDEDGHGMKVIYAKKWLIPVIGAPWIHKSIQAGCMRNPSAHARPVPRGHVGMLPVEPYFLLKHDLQAVHGKPDAYCVP